MTDLITTHQGVVYPWQCDHMGHMNVMWYVSKFDEATWLLMAQIGITYDYMREQQRGAAAVQQNITYQRELRPGDLITIRSGFVEVRGKVIRFVHEMSNNVTGEVAAIGRFTGVHMDTQLRKAVPLPQEMIEQANKLLVDYPAETR